MIYQTNCSETCYRLSLEDYEAHKKEIDAIVEAHGMGGREPIGGIGNDSEYSTMRPAKDEICFYFYQTKCNELGDFLNEIGVPWECGDWLIDTIVPDPAKVKRKPADLEL